MKQITEDYVSFETAVLLKEKGFDEPTRFWYNDKGIISQKYIDPTNNPIGKSWSYAAQTQSLVLKWLREVHNIVLDIAFEANKGWTFYVSRLITETLSDGSTCIVGILHFVWSNDVQQPYYKEHEQAVEAALKEALENLI